MPSPLLAMASRKLCRASSEGLAGAVCCAGPWLRIRGSQPAATSHTVRRRKEAQQRRRWGSQRSMKTGRKKLPRGPGVERSMGKALVRVACAATGWAARKAAAFPYCTRSPDVSSYLRNQRLHHSALTSGEICHLFT